YDDAYCDGKPRRDGTRSFLESRGIELPEGTPDDPPGTPTIYGLSNRKNALVLAKLAAGRVQVYEGTVTYIRSVREKGIATAIVSSSANTNQILASAGLAAATELHMTPSQAAVFEDALAGVEAGRAGHFALVVGVDRVGQADALAKHGADIVVQDLAELLDKDAR